jgi:predicted nuclease of predicted toxin-antitoxin system
MVARILFDENFSQRIIRGLLLRLPDADALRVQDVGLHTKDDPTILQWAASEGRVLITNDVETMVDFAYARVRDGLPMPGLVEIRRNLPIGKVIDDLILFIECSNEGEWEGKVIYFPLT